MANPQSVGDGSIQINYSLASQSAAGNYSVVNWNLQLVDAAIHGSSSYYNWSFNPGNLSGSGGWIYATNNTVIASGQITVYHDANGDGYVDMSGWFSWYNGSGTATARYTPPHINRYSEYSGGTPYAESITRQGFSVRVASALTFDNVATSLDGAGWVYWPGDSTNKAIAMATGLNSGTTHTFKTSLLNKSSQLWRESGTVNVTLSKQAITTFAASDISDVGFNINVVVDDTCDDLQISLDGGAYVSHPGDFTTKTLAIGGNLSSGVVHTIKARTHAKVSGAYVESSQIDVSTLPQNKFINFFDDRFGKGE